MLFMSCVSHAFVSFHCCLLVTCWERADLLALVGDVYCIFVTFVLIFAVFLTFNIKNICYIQLKIVSMLRKYHNHKLHTNPWQSEEESHGNNKTPERQTKQSNQL